MTSLRVGLARCDITPPLGIAHGNWSAQVHERAEGVDLPLWCTVLAATDGHEEVLIVEWDLLYPPGGEWLAALRDRVTALTGVPASHQRFSASHTHSGPNLARPWFEAGSEMIEPYVASLTDRVAGLCWNAHRNLRPARVAGGKGTCAVNSNRRRPRSGERLLMAPNPDGFSDHEVGVIRIDGEDGQPLAILVNFAAHPTILSWHNRLISTDYPGTVRRTVEALTGATCLFLQGAAGNQDTVRDFANRPEAARWVGRQIGLEAARVAEFIETQPTRPQVDHIVESSWTCGVIAQVPDGEPDGTVRALSRRVAVPLQQRPTPTVEERAHLDRLKARLADLFAQGAPDEVVREANMQVRRAALDLRVNERRSQGAHVELEFQAIRLGPTALMGIPVEPFAEIGAAVKAQSPFATTFFSGYTNGVELYMPTADAYPDGGYEVWMSPFAPQAADLTVAESVRLLNELHG